MGAALAFTSPLSSCTNLTTAIWPGFHVFTSVERVQALLWVEGKISKRLGVHNALSKAAGRRGKHTVITLKARLFLGVAEKLTF